MNEDQRHLNIVTGGTDVSPKPPQVNTREAAINYLQRSLDMLLERRKDCDVMIPDNFEATVAYQKKAERKLLIHVGKLMGEAGAFYARGDIEQATYEHFHTSAITAMARKLVGIVGAGGILERKRP